MSSLSPINIYRAGRVFARQLMATEPYVARSGSRPLEYHGGPAGGWAIPRDCLSAHSVVVDVGLGEDLDFSRQLHEKYGCAVHGFDPTPRAIAYAKRCMPPKFTLHTVAIQPALPDSGPKKLVWQWRSVGVARAAHDR